MSVRAGHRQVRRVAVLLLLGGAIALSSSIATHVLKAQAATMRGAQNETPYEATKLIWRWRGIMNAALEDARAFAPEAVTDEMEVFVSPGAVRAIQDKLNEEQLKKADAVVEQFAFAVVRASRRQDDGSRIVDEAAVDKGAEETCPVYPFCPQ
jgi:hypothetical protein